MNSFDSTQTNSGLLKDDYNTGSSLQDALSRKRKKLAETRLGLDDKDEEEKTDGG